MEDGELKEFEKQRGGEIHAVMSFVIALLVLAVGAGIGAKFFIAAVKAKQEEPEVLIPAVLVEAIALGDHQVHISSQGLVKSRRIVRLGSTVGGRVEWISENLVEGGRVTAGEKLVQIEDVNYKAALESAESVLADARLALELEKAKAVQAKRDWDKLGRGVAPNLVLRIPQIASAEAKMKAAESAIDRARRDSERTRIMAPFDGRVRRTEVEVGSVVGPGASVAEIYSDTDLEVRLPFSLEDYGYLREGEVPQFLLRAELGGKSRSWPAELVRIDGEVDRSTLSAYGIAKVILKDGDTAPPPVGLFVEAVIDGGVLERVVEIPRAGLRGEDQVWVVLDSKLQKRRVRVLRSTRDTLVVEGLAGAGFQERDQLVLTRLNAPIEGIDVRAQKSTERGAVEKD